MTCCVCGYTGNNRSFRNVGTTGHPDDVICNLCDEQERPGYVKSGE